MKTNKETESYVIVAQTPECVHDRYYKGRVICRANNGRVLRWVFDDNFGHGYSLSEAQKIIESMYDNCDDARYEDEGSVRELMAARSEDEGLEYNGELPDWYEGEGYYVNNDLICKAADMSFYDGGDIEYWIENNADIISCD